MYKRQGYDDGTFRPEKVITAAEFVKIAVLAADGEPRDSGGAFHWAEGWMRTARDAGWVTEEDIPGDTALWDAPITRETAVKILMCAVLPELTGSESQAGRIFDYHQVGARYREKVLAAFTAGVIRGDGNGMVRPQGSMTRAEACAVILRARRTAATGGEIPKTFQTGGVSQNGHLQVVGTQLCNERGEPILLRGMSSHGIAWFPQFVSGDSIRQVAQNGANLMRLAMYTKEYNGYLENPAVKETLIEAVDDSLANDLYTIIDWHVLSDGNPQEHQEEAIAFFQEMARRYRGNPGVLYEICNEPNGVTWAQIKTYAQAVISAIRQVDPLSLIHIWRAVTRRAWSIWRKTTTSPWTRSGTRSFTRSMPQTSCRRSRW